VVGWTDCCSQKGKPIEKFSPLEYINMEGEDDFEVKFSTEELV